MSANPIDLVLLLYLSLFLFCACKFFLAPADAFGSGTDARAPSPPTFPPEQEDIQEEKEQGECGTATGIITLEISDTQCCSGDDTFEIRPGPEQNDSDIESL
jgi:hypothetical protein